MDKETQKDTGKAKEKGKRTKDQAQKKKLVLKWEDLKKKTLSRNRSPSPFNALIRHPSKVSN